MYEAVIEQAPKNDIIIMAAAVSDWTVPEQRSSKIKKGDLKLNLELEATADILARLGERRKSNQVLVGFAAETTNTQQELVEIAQEKMERKKIDLICANNVADGRVFHSDQTHIYLIDHKSVTDLGEDSKLATARKIIDKSFEIWRLKQ